MQKYLFIAFMSITTCAFAAPQITGKSSEQEQVGYSFGYLMGKSNMNALNNLDFDSFVQGFQAGYKGQEASLSNEQMINILNQYKKKADAKELLDFQKAAEQNLQEGATFLKDNASKAGVKTTASGLQYIVLTQGQGKKPTLKNKVEVHYEGRLLNNTVFDSSIAREEAMTFQLNQVIKGWQEGVQLMPEGSKYRFFVPAKLAYGEIGSGDAIPPNSTLIFDIELLSIN